MSRHFIFSIRPLLGVLVVFCATMLPSTLAQSVRPGTAARPPSAGYGGPAGTGPVGGGAPNQGPIPSNPGAPVPTPVGEPGDPPPGTNPPVGGTTPSSTAGVGSGPGAGGAGSPAGGGRPGRGGKPGRKSDRRGGRTALGLAYPVDRWENWWALNQDQYLEVDRSYATRARIAEPSRDEFLGAEDVDDPASPVSFHRRAVKKQLIPVLLDYLHHSSPSVRGEAVLALGKVGGRNVVPALAPMTRDRNRFVRQMALLGLGMTRHREAVKPLLAFMIRRSNQNADRAHAALALGLIRDPLAVPALSAILDQSGRSQELTGAALYALGFMPGEDAVLILEDFLVNRGRRASLRGAAMLALGKSGRPALVPKLVRALTDPETHVRRSAALALGGQVFASPLWKKRDVLLAKLKRWEDTKILSDNARREFEDILADLERGAINQTQELHRVRGSVVKALKRALEKDGDRMVRNFAIISLGRIGSPAARVVLDGVLRARPSSESTRGFVAMALGISRARESSEGLRNLVIQRRLNPSIRGAVALALGLIKDQNSGPLLLELALQHTNTVRGYAAIGCGLMNHRPARGPFRKELEDEAQAYMRPVFGLALGLLGDHNAIEFLGKLIAQNRTGITRIRAAGALGSMRDLSSAQVLIKALSGGKATDMTLANFLHAAGSVAEKGTLPVLEPLARDWNYLMDFPLINRALLR